MFKQSPLCFAIAAAMMLPATAMAEIEVTTHLKNETAIFLKDGQATSSARSMLDDREHDAGDLAKFENSAKFFINGDLGEDSSWHAEVNFIYDTEAYDSDYKGHQLYTEHDWFRELYADTEFAGWSGRFGKQQVVWGTADGIKLLDIINPTDFRELVQNTFEDSRIPIWMANVERDIGENSNIQFIVSEVRANVIPGLDDDGANGHPFVAKGVDTITGDVNGFLNVAPALGRVATSFNSAAFAGLIGGVPSPAGLTVTSALTVEGFAGAPLDVGAATPAILLPGQPGYGTSPTSFIVPGQIPLNGIAQFGLSDGSFVDPNGNANVTNLMPVTGPTAAETRWDPTNPTSAFEYMSNATFATFNTFDGITTNYVRDYPDGSANAGFRFKHTFNNGLNVSANYFHHYGANPDVNIDWYDPSTGEKLTVQRAPVADFISNTTGAPGPDGIPDFADPTISLTPDEVATDLSAPGASPTTLLLHNDAGVFYGTFDPTGGFQSVDPSTGNFLNTNTTKPELRFTEELHRIDSFGASFDLGLNTEIPIVIRGEFLYDHNDRQPVVDKRLLAVGDISNALKMEKADYFKYVLGVDVTVLTNLLVSTQFIQFRNLDYVDDDRKCVTQTGKTFDCSTYTADFATLSMENGLNQGWENKEFVSFFLSKPFGEDQLGRWNNIIIWEEGGGYWNRLDAEYSVTDNLIVGGELNFYWGDEDTQFGQFEDSSNAQVSVKYILE